MPGLAAEQLSLYLRENNMLIDRRLLLRYGALVSCAGLVPPLAMSEGEGAAEQSDYSLRIATGLIELAPEHIVSTTLYNGQFPGHAGTGPLARPDHPERGRWCSGRGHTLRAGTRDASDRLRTQ